jgi:hypothetical protein
MVLYTCEKCNKGFNRKSNYLAHLNKKIPCLKNVLIDDNKLKIIQIHHNSSKIIQNKDEHKCGLCLKSFLNSYNLKKHVENNCKIKKKKEDEREEILQQLVAKYEKSLSDAVKEIKSLHNEIDELKKHNHKSKNTNIKNNNNITNSNNTTNNIIMMDFGKENLQIIDKSEFIKIVKNNRITGVKITDELLKAIHFNDKYPQLNNIYISDINRQKCMIVQDNEWKLSPVDQIPQVIDNIIKYSNENNEELSEKYKDNKSIINRLKIIDKYTKLSNPEHLDELIEEEAPPKDIKRCKDFQQYTYDTVKTTLYNKGKKNKKLIK